ncbi:response regulator [bacterium]|nr:response regulator [bacterium]MBU1064196.1 response regulator [bacterium]MBU1633733.1 response regulator [bacterium]MBU1874353.1 response regulator [bacterium]
MKNKILIVGDESGIFFAFKKMLKGEHYQMVTSSQPNEIFHLVLKLHPSLLILNLKLYGNFRAELLVQLKKTFPSLPILAMTTFTNVLTEKLIMRLGASGYIRMPFDIHEMLVKIRQLSQYQNA